MIHSMNAVSVFPDTRRVLEWTSSRAELCDKAVCELCGERGTSLVWFPFKPREISVCDFHYNLERLRLILEGYSFH